MERRDLGSGQCRAHGLDRWHLERSYLGRQLLVQLVLDRDVVDRAPVVRQRLGRQLLVRAHVVRGQLGRAHVERLRLVRAHVVRPYVVRRAVVVAHRFRVWLLVFGLAAFAAFTWVLGLPAGAWFPTPGRSTALWIGLTVAFVLT